VVVLYVWVVATILVAIVCRLIGGDGCHLLVAIPLLSTPTVVAAITLRDMNMNTRNADTRSVAHHRDVARVRKSLNVTDRFLSPDSSRRTNDTANETVNETHKQPLDERKRESNKRATSTTIHDAQVEVRDNQEQVRDNQERMRHAWGLRSVTLLASKKPFNAKLSDAC
jgi:hypothetical protein